MPTSQRIIAKPKELPDLATWQAFDTRYYRNPWMARARLVVTG